jgi:iron complex outermembrane receptor protein
MMERYGNGGIVVGNPDLTPERGLNADLGATVTGTAGPIGLRVDGTLFASRAEDLIHFQRATYFGRYRNIGRARVLGAELALALRALRYGHLLAQGTLTDARDVSGFAASDGKQLPHRPRVRGYVRPELRGLPLGGGLEGGLFGDLDVTSGNYLDAANLVAVPARVLVGAGAFLGAPRLGLRLVATAQNLGDSRINDVHDFPLPGRSLFATLEWSTPTPVSHKELSR